MKPNPRIVTLSSENHIISDTAKEIVVSRTAAQSI